MEYEIINNVH